MTSRAGSLSLSQGWIDVSVPLRAGMVHWPGDPPLETELVHDMSRGDQANLTKICSSAHVGTHMDAPHHFVRDGAGIDAAPLAALIGDVRVTRLDEVDVIRERDVAPLGFRGGERVLFRTRNSARAWWEEAFQEHFVHLAADAAHHLARCGVQTVGVDYLSVGGYQAPDSADVHRALLSSGVWIIEGLDLTQVDAGDYEMICLPMKLVGRDGGPARVLLRPIRASS